MSPRVDRHGARGASMIALLVGLVVLAVLAVIILKATSSTTPSGVPISAPGGTTVVTNPAGIVSVAASKACEADFDEVSQAVTDYQTLNGSLPPRGTTWATSASSGPLLQSWPSNSSYRLIWNGSHLIVHPAHGRASVGTFGTASPPTGCFAH